MNGRPQSARQYSEHMQCAFIAQAILERQIRIELRIDGLMKSPKVMASTWKTASKHLPRARVIPSNFRRCFVADRRRATCAWRSSNRSVRRSPQPSPVTLFGLIPRRIPEHDVSPYFGRPRRKLTVMLRASGIDLVTTRRYPRPVNLTATQLPAVIGGKYRPVRLIGQGGMGVVYEVVHANTGEHFALKLMLARTRLTPDLVDRFRREARAAAAVKSDHVVRVTDADLAPELEGAPFLVMELLIGRDFERICAERQPAPSEVVDWLRQVARGLDKAHRQEVVHRDLKPENIFLAEVDDHPPIVKILDFGIAKMAMEGAPETSEGRILGTPRYMAPEQANDAREATSAADRFSLGLIAFRLLCGRHYFLEESPMKLLLEVSRGPSSPPSSLGSNLGAAFDDWFARACSYDPRQRFASCDQQVEALAAALALPVRSVPTLVSAGGASDPSNPELPTANAVADNAATLNANTVSGARWLTQPGGRSLTWLVPAIVGLGASAAWKVWPVDTGPSPAASSFSPPVSSLSTLASAPQPAPERPTTACGFTMPNPVSAGLPNPASYTESLVDGAVTDNLTGLTWEGTVEPTTVYTQGQAMRHCNDKGGSWRLPTRVELVSLVDFSFPKPGPTINAIFKHTPGERFWTSSYAAYDPTTAWYVGFDYGSTHQERADVAHRVRCVSGAPSHCSPTRFQVRADGLVFDAATELTWQRTVATKQTWGNASAFCRTLGANWRLPSLTELQTIVDETKQNPPIDGVAFPNTPGDAASYFWTSTLQAGRSDYAWYVVFIHGHADLEPTTTAYWVRCVR